MSRTLNLFVALGLAASVVAAPAFAQTPAAPATSAPAAATPAAKPAAPATTAAPKAARSAKSMDCSKQADAKGLHGKARKKFRDECKKG